jgi:four helix bundle protein
MRDHRSLICWVEAKAVSRGVLQLAERYWKPWLSAVFSQLLRSSLSVQLNIAEGYGLKNTGSFLRHLTIAYASAIETGETLELLAESKGELGSAAKGLLVQCARSQRLLLGMIRRYSRDQSSPTAPAHR